MDSAEQQVVDRLKEARNILVTVRNDPTVDLLSALIGLTLGLDKMDKHVAAVFSGEVPSTIEFLKPLETIEQSPDSLRDFIIALDKSKADKLRYKVEDKVVRIFITPYKTSLSQDDLEFSQGDFNVDAVVALGAHEQKELDQAITSHGRILHDATVMSINDTPNGNLGSINWQDTTASSISELVTQLIKDLNKSVLDEQIATALLTGIVAETDRFSNEKTTPKAMSLAGDLMSAGANQQLVATELDDGSDQPLSAKPGFGNPSDSPQSLRKADTEPSKTDDGSLSIDHAPPNELKTWGAPPIQPPDSAKDRNNDDSLPELPFNRDMLPLPAPPKDSGVSGGPTEDSPFADAEIPQATDEGTSSVGRSFLVDETTPPVDVPPSPNLVEPQTANPFDVPPSAPEAPLLTRDYGNGPTTPPSQVQSPQASPSEALTPDNETLEEIEESVHSTHLQSQTEETDVDAARNEVLKALQDGPKSIKPLDSLNANPLGGELHPSEEGVALTPQVPPHREVEIDNEGNFKPNSSVSPNIPASPNQEPVLNPSSDDEQPLDMPLPSIIASGNPVASPNLADPLSVSPNSPPPVPPPFMPPNYTNPNS